MKNAINYYYNLVTYDIRHKGKKYRFKVDNDEYLLCRCDYDIEELEEIYKLNGFLLQFNIYVHQIILNINNQIITYINNEPYILMRIFITENRKININDIISFGNFSMYNYFPLLQKNNWRNFWIRKIDYFEYQISETGINYNLIRDSFNYFVGMTETAISLLYDFEYNGGFIISHRRITPESTLEDLYNPINLIIDSKVRDICEYFKNGFFKGQINLSDIKNYLSTIFLTEQEKYLFYVRMLYPSFYFDLYEKVINELIDEKEMIKIIDKISDYQLLLKDLYWYLRIYIKLPDIEWIIKT